MCSLSVRDFSEIFLKNISAVILNLAYIENRKLGNSLVECSLGKPGYIRGSYVGFGLAMDSVGVS